VIPGEEPRAAPLREVLEETGLAVEVEALSGVYLRRGFLPHAREETGVVVLAG
jgi:ADP-ribose pyrophosphatase YjhB (NUDIX family)